MSKLSDIYEVLRGTVKSTINAAQSCCDKRRSGNVLQREVGLTLYHNVLRPINVKFLSRRIVSLVELLVCFVLFFSRPRSQGWPHHGRRPTFSIYPCPLSFWLTLPRESCTRLDVHTGRAWSSSPACTWHCSLHYLFLQATPLFPHGVTIVYASFLALTVSNSSLFTPALLRTHSFVFFAVHETRRIFLSPFISKASKRVSSFFLRVQLSQPYVATGHTSAFISHIFVEVGMLWLFHIGLYRQLTNVVYSQTSVSVNFQLQWVTCRQSIQTIRCEMRSKADVGLTADWKRWRQTDMYGIGILSTWIWITSTYFLGNYRMG